MSQQQRIDTGPLFMSFWINQDTANFKYTALQ